MDQPTVTIKRMLLYDCRTAALQLLTLLTAKMLIKMKTHPDKPPMKPVIGGITLVSPQKPKVNIATVPRKSHQNIMAEGFCPAAFRIRLNSIICKGTVMLQ